ncbi:hypothetical protein RIF29_28726 [Crotalaria pallida]|uniref:Uncharacterized protein n=1 Tax=Crotalaria pallida TaxID=3830 RepID=A0AAN9EE62_CROPI
MNVENVWSRKNCDEDRCIRATDRSHDFTHIWRERNRRFFTGEMNSASVVFEGLKREIAAKLVASSPQLRFGHDRAFVDRILAAF